jgi:outer membrane protein
MKKYNLTLTSVLMVLVAIFSIVPQAQAQKFAYVDTEFILSQLPTYRSAQKQIDEQSEKWQKEIDKMYQDIDKMYKNYQAEKVILSGELQKKREEEIIAKEREAKKYQQDKFGFEGELFKKRQELIKPIQDQVYDAIQKIAKENALDFIFDKSGDMVMLFSNRKYDKSGEVLQELGVAPTTENPGAKPGSQNDLPPAKDTKSLPPK